jgi:hypothetical protein
MWEWHALVVMWGGGERRERLDLGSAGDESGRSECRAACRMMERKTRPSDRSRWSIVLRQPATADVIPLSLSLRQIFRGS